MPYRREDFSVGDFYHVYNRGLLRQIIFPKRSFYERFLTRLGDCLLTYDFSLHAYCLMPNHFHLLLQQNGNWSLTDMMNSLQASYSKYLNIRLNKKGQVFEGRFKAKRIDGDEYLLQVSKYIHLNPLKAGLVDKLLLYRWSSYQSYVGGLKEVFVTTDFVMGYFEDFGYQGSYLEFVNSGFKDEDLVLMAEEFVDVDQ